MIEIETFLICIILSFTLGGFIVYCLILNDTITQIDENFKYLNYENLLKENKELKTEINVLKRIVKGGKK